jgi:two-component system response regulator HupR/HoxA
MSGLELLRAVKEKYPHIVRMVLSGYTQVTTLLTAINQGTIFKFITKPWDFKEEFKPAVLDAIEYYNSQNRSNGTAEEEDKHKGESTEKVLEGSK